MYICIYLLICDVAFTSRRRSMSCNHRLAVSRLISVHTLHIFTHSQSFSCLSGSLYMFSFVIVTQKSSLGDPESRCTRSETITQDCSAQRVLYQSLSLQEGFANGLHGVLVICSAFTLSRNSVSRTFSTKQDSKDSCISPQQNIAEEMLHVMTSAYVSLSLYM